MIGLRLLQNYFSLDEISLTEFSFDGICIKETVTLKSTFIMNTTQIVEQDKIQLGEIIKEEQEPRSSPKMQGRGSIFQI